VLQQLMAMDYFSSKNMTQALTLVLQHVMSPELPSALAPASACFWTKNISTNSRLCLLQTSDAQYFLVECPQRG
jgi:hypothetical protein